MKNVTIKAERLAALDSWGYTLKIQGEDAIWVSKGGDITPREFYEAATGYDGSPAELTEEEIREIDGAGLTEEEAQELGVVGISLSIAELKALVSS